MLMLENANKTPLSEYGEFGLIELLTKNIKLKNQSTILGVGDDAAILHAQNRYQLVSKDLLMEGIHFDIRYYPLKHLGYKAITVNLSDITAMNAKPEQVLIGIAASSRYTVEAIEEIYAGMHLCCQHYGVDLVGGDTTSSVSGLCISVTALGYAQPETIVRRSTAQTNDLICVSGDLGGAYMGLMILEREKEVFLKDPKAQPDLDGFDYILQRQLKPEPRLDIVNILKEKNILPTAMIDISDGLAQDLGHILEESNLGAVIYEDLIPLSKAAGGINSALNDGEDFELLFHCLLSKLPITAAKRLSAGC